MTEIARLTAVLEAVTTPFQSGMAKADAAIADTSAALVRMDGQAAAMGEAMNAAGNASARGMEKAAAASQAAAVRQGEMAASSAKSSSGMLMGLNPVTGALAALGVTLYIGEHRMKKMEEVTAVTEARLESTRGRAHATKESIEGLTKSIQDKTGIDRLQLQASANTLMMYGNVRNAVGAGNDIYNQAIHTVAELGRTNEDYGAKAKALGKALNDPAKGVGILARAGVGLTAVQKEQIKTLAEHGHQLEAQKLMLKDVNEAVGPVAEKMGQTLDGALGRAKLAFEDMALSVLETALPSLMKLADVVTRLMPIVGAAFKAVLTVIEPVMEIVAEVIDTVVGAFEANAGKFTAFAEKIKTAFGEFAAPIIRAFTDVAGGGNKVGETMDRIRPLVTQFANALNVVGDYAIKVAPTLGQYVAQAITVVAGLIQRAAPYVRTLADTLMRIGQNVLPIVIDAFHQVAPPITRLVTDVAKFSIAFDTAMLKIAGVVINVLGRVLPPLVKAVAPYFRGAFGAIGEILNAVSAILEGRWGEALHHLASAPKKFLGGIGATISNLIGMAVPAVVEAASNLGSQLVDGIKTAVGNGISDLGGFIGDKLSGILHSIDIPGGSPVKSAGGHLIGEPLAKGIAIGFLNGTSDLGDKIATTLKNKLVHAKNQVDAATPAMERAFGRLGDMAMRAFDAKTQKHIDDIRARLANANTLTEGKFAGEAAGTTTRFGDKIKAAEESGRALTPAERMLKAAQDEHDAEARARSMREAQAALTKAQTEADEQAIADAQQRIAELNYEERVRVLQAQADAERAQSEKNTATKVATLQADMDTALAAIETRKQAELAANAARFADEELQYQSQRDVQRQARQDELDDLLASLQKRNKHYHDNTKKLKRLLDSMAPGLAESGTNLGTAFADALASTEGDVKRSIIRIANMIDRYLHLHSPAKEGPLSTLDSWWRPMGKTLADGVDASMIGTVAASISSPDMSGVNDYASSASSGGTVINVTVQGTVTSERELVATIRSELLKTGQRNGSIFGGLA